MIKLHFDVPRYHKNKPYKLEEICRTHTHTTNTHTHSMYIKTKGAQIFQKEEKKKLAATLKF